MSDKTSSASIRKVAILIDSVNEAIGDQLLSQMSLEKSAEVREALELLVDISQTERDEVTGEFLAKTGWNREDVLPEIEATRDHSAGAVELELSDSLAQEELPHESDFRPQQYPAVSPDTSSASPGVVTPSNAASSHLGRSEGGKPLRFVTAEQIPTLAELMQRESDQFSAAVLHLVEPDIAVQLLEHFHQAEQVRLLRRLATTDDTSDEVTHEIVSAVRNWLQEHHEGVVSTTGWQAVRQILSVTGWDYESSLLNSNEQKTGTAPSPPSSASMPREGERRAGLFRVTSDGPREVASEIAPQVASASQALPANSNGDVGSSNVAAFQQGNSKPTSMVSKTMTREQKRKVPLTSRDVAPANGVSLELSSQDVKDEANSLDLQRTIEAEFDELHHWDAQDLIQLCQATPPRILRLALAGAQPVLLARIRKALSRREATRLFRDLDRSEPMRLADICQAQQAMLAIADGLSTDAPQNRSGRPTSMAA